MPLSQSVWYNKQTHCRTCGSSLRSAPFRICPNAVHIQQYLRETSGFDGNFTKSDWVCTVYYKSHLQILKETPHSTDSDLLTLINTLKGGVHQFSWYTTLKTQLTELCTVLQFTWEKGYLSRSPSSCLLCMRYSTCTHQKFHKQLTYSCIRMICIVLQDAGY